LTYGLEGLLVLHGEGTSLQGDDWGSGFGVVVDGRATLAAEDTVDGLAGGTDTSPALGRAGDVELVLGNDSDKGWRRAVSVNPHSPHSNMRRNSDEAYSRWNQSGAGNHHSDRKRRTKQASQQCI
jgi:hypothetical protein